MEKVILVSPTVIQALKKLVWILYNEEYFGFEEDAHKYVDKLRKAIHKDLPNLPHHSTPPELQKYGSYYVKLKGNKRTMWYVFFDKKGHRYVVEFITNNYSQQSAYLNKL